MKLKDVVVASLALAMVGCFSGPSTGESAEANEVVPDEASAEPSGRLQMKVSAEVPNLDEATEGGTAAGESDSSPELQAEAAFRELTWSKMQERSDGFKACAGEDFESTNAYFEAVAIRGAEGFVLGSLKGEQSESALGRCVSARMQDVLGEVHGEAPEHVNRLGFSVWLLGSEVKQASCSGERVICQGMNGVDMSAELRGMTFEQESSCPHSEAIIAGGEEVFQDAIACHQMGQSMANAGGDAMPLGAQAWVAVRYAPELDQHFLYARYTDARYEPVARCLVDAHKALALEGDGQASCQQNLCSRLYSFAMYPVLSLMVH